MDTGTTQKGLSAPGQWSLETGAGIKLQCVAFDRNDANGVPLEVEPQEKPKTPKGRALKRIKYTRRFVNVTMTGGKRKVSCMEITRICVEGSADHGLDEPQPRLVKESPSRGRGVGANVMGSRYLS